MVPYICHSSVYRPFKERSPLFLWPNAESKCGHTHLLLVVVKRLRHWYISSFLGWLWPPFSCADRITGNIVGGTSNNFVIQLRHYQIFTIGSKIIGSSGFLCYCGITGYWCTMETILLKSATYTNSKFSQLI